MTTPDPLDAFRQEPPTLFDALRPEDSPPPNGTKPDAAASAQSLSDRARAFVEAKRPAGDRRDDKKKKTKPAVPNRKGQFVEPLTSLYGMLGTLLMPVDPVCGNAIIQSAEQCAKALDDYAYRNETARRVLWALTQTSALGAVIMAHAPIFMAVAMHHIPAVQRAIGSRGAAMADAVAAEYGTIPDGVIVDEPPMME